MWRCGWLGLAEASFSYQEIKTAKSSSIYIYLRVVLTNVSTWCIVALNKRIILEVYHGREEESKETARLVIHE